MNNDPWYASLRKAPLTPPPAVFPIVWSILYVMIAASFVVFLIKGGWKSNPWGLALFLAQLALNIAWTPVFFKQRNTKGGFAIIIVMLALIVGTIVSFWSTSKAAAALLMPYAAWVTLASYLNGYIVVKNG